MHVEIEHITKVFGKVRANDNVSLTLNEGMIYAVLGENGAGKSTLMKILSGYQPADSGQIVIDSKPAVIKTPADALAYGIGMLHQDPLDVPNLTVLENYILGRRGSLVPDRHTARRSLLDYAGRLGFMLNPDAYADSLTIGERQQLEIVRLLSLGAKLLILDEPTTGISAEQKETLFQSLRRLAAQDKLIVVLVSHKLEDVEALCNSAYVLRQGKVVGQQQMPYPTDQLVALMFGQSIQRTTRPDFQPGAIILNVQHVSIPGRRLVVHDVNLSIHAGEVIGLAGLDGSGQTALLRACAGLQSPSSGHIRFADQDITHGRYHDLVPLGIAYAPAGRLEEGLVAGLTLAEHFALVRLGGPWIDWRNVRQYTEQQISRYNIRGRASSPIQTLSGGNQQRTLLALLPANLRLLLLEDPTRGLDVESTRWVWQQLLERRSQGTAILFAAPDLDEIIEYSDRIVVFFGGRTTLVDDTAHISGTQLGELIGGKAL